MDEPWNSASYEAEAAQKQIQDMHQRPKGLDWGENVAYKGG